MDPKPDDVMDVTAPFSIGGGGTHTLVAEFVGAYPGVVPDQRAHPVVIEALSSLTKGWREVLAFNLQLGNLIHPANYIVYTNQHDYLSDQEPAEGAENLAKLRSQWGLDTGAVQT